MPVAHSSGSTWMDPMDSTVPSPDVNTALYPGPYLCPVSIEGVIHGWTNRLYNAISGSSHCPVPGVRFGVLPPRHPAGGPYLCPLPIVGVVLEVNAAHVLVGAGEVDSAAQEIVVLERGERCQLPR